MYSDVWCVSGQVDTDVGKRYTLRCKYEYDCCLQVPSLWAGAAYPSLKPLSSWVKDLVLRINFIEVITVITRARHQYHISITSISHQYHINITSVSHQYHISITSISHQYHTNITSLSHQYHISITSVSHQYHIIITAIIPYFLSRRPP